MLRLEIDGSPKAGRPLRLRHIGDTEDEIEADVLESTIYGVGISLAYVFRTVLTPETFQSRIAERLSADADSVDPDPAKIGVATSVVFTGIHLDCDLRAIADTVDTGC